MKSPILVIHGGAGSRVPKGERADTFRLSLERILQLVYPRLKRGLSAHEAVVLAVEALENDPLYNAGRGSKIQSDGKIRMSASLMDGSRHRFAGCVNVERVKNPVRLAERLLRSPDRVLAGRHADQFARKEGLAFGSPYTRERRDSFQRGAHGKSGTVGAVALDRQGRLAAATSTGGRGGEYPGRVSDTPTVAANFANRLSAVSATGIGEQITEAAAAATLCALVGTGKSLLASGRQVITNARRTGARFGLIALDHQGEIFASTTTSHLIWASATSRGLELHP